MRASGDVEDDPVASILLDQRRVAITPLDKLGQTIAGNARDVEAQKTACHFILPAPRAWLAPPAWRGWSSVFDRAIPGSISPDARYGNREDPASTGVH